MFVEPEEEIEPDELAFIEPDELNRPLDEVPLAVLLPNVPLDGDVLLDEPLDPNVVPVLPGELEVDDEEADGFVLLTSLLLERVVG